MGGSSTSYKTTWRDSRVRVCTCMVDALNEGARLLTVRAKALGLRDHTVLGIPYFGSWQDGTTASGDIGAGGGHIDIDLTGYADAERKLLEAIMREVGFYADIRLKRIYSPKLNKTFVFTWATHLHMVMKDCPHRTSLAKSQVYQWQKNAADGLAATPDLDDGPRDFLYQTWEQYKARAAGKPAPSPVRPKTYTVKGGDTLGKIAAAFGVSVLVLLGANGAIKDANVIKPGQVLVVPPKGATATPAPAKPAAKPPVKAPVKVAPKPVVKPKPKPKPKPVVKPKPAKTTRVDASKLHKGIASRHVTAYQKALRAYLGTKVANRYNPSGATGFYGSQTQALTKAAYRKLGATPWATEPGPGLLKVLKLR